MTFGGARRICRRRRICIVWERGRRRGHVWRRQAHHMAGGVVVYDWEIMAWIFVCAWIGALGGSGS